jgi:hypothetical protein
VHPGPEHRRVIRQAGGLLESAKRSAEQGLGACRCSRGVGENRFLDEAGDVVVQVAADLCPQISTVGVMTGRSASSGRKTNRTRPRGAGSMVNRPSSSASAVSVRVAVRISTFTRES